MDGIAAFYGDRVGSCRGVCGCSARAQVRVALEHSLLNSNSVAEDRCWSVAVCRVSVLQSYEERSDVSVRELGLIMYHVHQAIDTSTWMSKTLILVNSFITDKQTLCTIIAMPMSHGEPLLKRLFLAVFYAHLLLICSGSRR